MDIKIKFFSGESFVIKLNDSNTVKELAEKIVENEVSKKYNFCIHSMNLMFSAEIMKYDKKLSYYKIKEGDKIDVIIKDEIKAAGCIDNLKEESKSEIAKK